MILLNEFKIHTPADETRDFLHANPSRQATAVTLARFRVQGSYAKGHLNSVPRAGAFGYVGTTEAFVPPISYFYPPKLPNSGQCLRFGGDRPDDPRGHRVGGEINYCSEPIPLSHLVRDWSSRKLF